MKPIFILLLILITGHCFSQMRTDPQAKQFINEFVRNNEKAKNLYYNAYLDPGTIDRIVRIFDYWDIDTSFWYPDNRIKAALVLSTEEKELIKNALLYQKNKAWDNNLIEHATLFKRKDIPEHFTKEQRLEYLQQFEGKSIIHFSMPVFLQNNSLCVFFYASGGGGTLYILKKEDQKWKKFVSRVIYYN